MIPGVPYDAEIEYLESTGTQYIDTGIVPDSSTGAKAVFLIRDTSRSNYVLGSRAVGAARFYLYNNEQSSFVRYGWGNLITTNTSALVNSVTEVALNYLNDGKYVYANTELAALPSTSFSANSYRMFLFNSNFAGGAFDSAASLIGYIKSCKITQGSTLVRDFIPVRVGQTGYMYDRVSRRLFGNKGTGSFVLGPDVAKPVIGLYGMRKRKFEASDYIQDGLIAQWDGVENAGYNTHVASLSNWVDLKGGPPCTLYKNTVTENGMRFEYYWTTRGGTFNRVFPWQNATFEVVTSNVGAGTSTRFLFQSGCSTSRDPSVAIAYSGGVVNTLCYYTGSGTSYTDGASGMLGGTYCVTTGTDTSAFLLYRNGLLAELAGTGRWNIQRGWGACLAYRGTDQAQINFPKVTIHGVRVYSRALSPAEIAHNYAIDKARFNLP